MSYRLPMGIRANLRNINARHVPGKNQQSVQQNNARRPQGPVQNNNLNRSIQNGGNSHQNSMQNTQAGFGGLGNMPGLPDRQLTSQNNGQNGILLRQPQEVQQQNSQSGGGNDGRLTTPLMSPNKPGELRRIEPQISDIKSVPSQTSVGTENQIGQSPVPDAGMPTGNGNLQQAGFNGLSIFQGQNFEENEGMQRQTRENDVATNEALNFLNEWELGNNVPENGSDPKPVVSTGSLPVSKTNSVGEIK